ncbi:hypothetical protein UA74_27645 [Actinoalloteichus fjordicus]|uniref:Uncharacterized protein n=1 Tax=Actinoalloteichus fjordicus TaxID=1612552 RepID=A0AAC9LH74_9PSEU|nr:hypothetical protein UA74_27645 [Actinoalloteichus fjordicus]
MPVAVQLRTGVRSNVPHSGVGVRSPANSQPTPGRTYVEPVTGTAETGRALRTGNGRGDRCGAARLGSLRRPVPAESLLCAPAA